MEEMSEVRKYHFILLKPKNKCKRACLLLPGTYGFLTDIGFSELKVRLTKNGVRGVRGGRLEGKTYY